MSNGNWVSVSQRMPTFGEPVRAKIKHHTNGTLMDVALVRVDESDCTWRTLDDNSELSFNWSVVSWREATQHDKLTARHTKAATWLDRAVDKCGGDFTREELMLEAVYQNCCLIHKNPTDFVNGIRRVLGEDVPQPLLTPTWCADALKTAGGGREPLFTPDGAYPYDAVGRYVELNGKVVVVLKPIHGKPYRLTVRTEHGGFMGRLKEDQLEDYDLKPHVGDTATIRVYAPDVDADDVITSWSPVYPNDEPNDEPNYRRRESLTGED